MKIYAVKEYGGQWEDSWERIVCAYEDRAEAEKLIGEIITAHEKQEKQKEKCQDCEYMFYRTGDRPDCFEPVESSPEDCATLDIIYDDWCGVMVRELEYVPIQTDKEATHNAENLTEKIDHLTEQLELTKEELRSVQRAFEQSEERVRELDGVNERQKDYYEGVIGDYRNIADNAEKEKKKAEQELEDCLNTLLNLAKRVG